jgi:hypothetical protein
MENIKDTWNLPSQLLNAATNANFETTTVESWGVPINILNVLRTTDTANTNNFRKIIIITTALAISFIIILLVVLFVLRKKNQKHTNGNKFVDNEATNDSRTSYAKQTEAQKNDENSLIWDPNGVNLTQNALENDSVDHDLLNVLKEKNVRSSEEWRLNPSIDSYGNRIAPNGKIVQICIGCHFYYVKETGLANHQKSCTYFLCLRKNHQLVLSSSVVENHDI